MNRNRNAGFHFLRKTDDVPVCEPNASMTGGAPDRLRLASSMEANTFPIERDPDHSDWTVRTRREHMEGAAALAVFEDLFFVAVWRPLCDTPLFPFPKQG